MAEAKLAPIPFPRPRLTDPVEMKAAAARLIDRAQKLLREAASIEHDHRAVPTICKECAVLFEFSPEQVQWYASQGWKLPVRCPACREQKRQIKAAYSEGRRWPSGWPRED